MKNSDDSTSFHFIRPLPLPPIIYATIDLCFASYLPIDALNEIIGLQATEAAPRSAMRINPLTGKQNPGYWIYKLPPLRDFDSMDLTEQLNMVLTEHETGFRKAMQKYEPAELILRFYTEAQEARQFPSVSLSSDMIRTAASLGARVEVITECYCCEEPE